MQATHCTRGDPAHHCLHAIYTTENESSGTPSMWNTCGFADSMNLNIMTSPEHTPPFYAQSHADSIANVSQI